MKLASDDSLPSYDVTKLDHDFFGVFLTEVEKNRRLGSHIFSVYLGKSTPLINLVGFIFMKSQPFCLNEVVRGPSNFGNFVFFCLYFVTLTSDIPDEVLFVISASFLFKRGTSHQE